MNIDLNEIKALIQLLDDPDREVSEQVRRRFMEFGNAAIPHLEKEWETITDPDIQGQVENMVHHLQFENVKKRLQHWLDNEQDNLLKGMWCLATYLYPNLSFALLHEQVEQMYFNFWVKFRHNMHPLDQVKLLNRLFFEEKGFKANVKHFHSVQNSMINQILETKKSNPIGLSALYLVLAKKLRLPIYGVNLPNLFVMIYKVPQIQFYINAFNKGTVFAKQDIDQYLGQLQIKPQPVFYEPCTHLDIIQRMLRNMIVSFEKEENAEKMAEVQALLNMTEPFDKPL